MSGISHHPRRPVGPTLHRRGGVMLVLQPAMLILDLLPKNLELFKYPNISLNKNKSEYHHCDVSFPTRAVVGLFTVDRFKNFLSQLLSPPASQYAIVYVYPLLWQILVNKSYCNHVFIFPVASCPQWQFINLSKLVLCHLIYLFPGVY